MLIDFHSKNKYSHVTSFDIDNVSINNIEYENILEDFQNVISLLNLEDRKIISKIISNNTYSLSKVANAGNVQTASTLTSQVSQGSIKTIIQNKSDFLDKLIVQTEVIQFGSKQCAGIQPPTFYNNLETTRVTYSGKDGGNISKTVNKFEDVMIESYYYSHIVTDGENTKSRVVEYRGGSYALESTYTSPKESIQLMPVIIYLRPFKKPHLKNNLSLCLVTMLNFLKLKETGRI